MDTITMDSLKTALFLLHDLRLWPVAIRPGEKAPIGEAWGVTRPTEESLRQIYREFPGAGLGIKLGPEGGVVDIECDGPQGEDSLYKLFGGEIVNTLGWGSSRGPHGVFLYDARLAKYAKSIIKHPALPGLEIRIGSSGKQLQSNCPPTVGSDGKPRRWNGTWVIATLPDAVFEMLDRLMAPPPVPAGSNGQARRITSGSDAETRARAYARKIDPAVSGSHGHDRTFYAACKIGPGFDLPPDVAFRVLVEEYNPKCAPPWSERDIRHKLDDVYRVEPRRGWLLDSPPSSNGHAGGNGSLEPKADIVTPEWALDQPILNRNGEQKVCAHNSQLWLRAQGICVRLDTFKQTVLLDGEVLTDELVISLAMQIERELRVPWRQDVVRAAIVDLGVSNSFSSLTTYLDGLEWDGVPRIDHFFADYYGCEFSPYTAACAGVFFLSAVARAYQPGCAADVMPVLMGSQGIGKSKGMALLCPDPKWFADDLGCDLHDRKAGEGLRGKWLIEWSEFSRISRTTADVYKGFLSRQSDYFRPAYGRDHKDFPRQCAFFGTTNSTTPLQDEENRRFMPISVVAADFQGIASSRDQLWAEAVLRHQRGEKWWETSATLACEIRQKQEDARNRDAWEDILEVRLANQYETTVTEAAEKLDIKPWGIDRSTQIRIGLALKKIGFVGGKASKINKEGRRPTVYTRQ